MKLFSLSSFLLLVSLLGAMRPEAPKPAPVAIRAVLPLPPPAPPNILWISCEDMSPRLGCYGDSTIPTPNIDRLAREGIRYTNAFTTAGVCAPSRSAIITGMYQTTTGGHNMRTLYDTYPAETGLPKQYSVVMPPEVKAFPEYLRINGYYTVNNVKTDYQFDAPPTVWDEVSKEGHWRKRPAGKPFFAVLNNTVTHESQVWARKELPLRVDPARIKVPPYYPDTKTVRADMARFYSNIADLDDWVGEVMGQLEADGLLDNTIVFFWSDHGDGLPFIKREIYDRGIRVPLIVRFPDKRFAGTSRDELISMIDLAPTVLRLTGVEPLAYMQGRAFLDPATGKRPAKVPPRPYVFAARDRLDSEYDRVRTVHDGRYQYMRNFFPDKPLYMDIDFRKQQPMMAEMLRLRDAGKLNETQMQWFRPTKPAEELYDLKTDPFQLNNVAGKPEYAAHLQRLRQEMDRWLIQTKDRGGVPEQELVRQMWQGQSEPPVTEAPQMQMKGDKLVLSSPTKGASIAYKVAGRDSVWQVYHQPLRLARDRHVTAVAQRIGYKPSEEVTLAAR